MAPEAGSDAAKLGKALQDPQKRKKFKENRDAFFRDEGIDPAQVSKAVPVLSGLSLDELAVVARTNQDLTQAGVSREHRGDMV